jgi:hypothetical protein
MVFDDGVVDIVGCGSRRMRTEIAYQVFLKNEGNVVLIDQGFRPAMVALSTRLRAPWFAAIS